MKEPRIVLANSLIRTNTFERLDYTDSDVNDESLEYDT